MIISQLKQSTTAVTKRSTDLLGEKTIEVTQKY